jgi:hypothetical protein
VSRFVAAAAFAIALGAAPAARAQPMMGGGAGGMPDLRAVSGKPLPDPGMPAGTITVRVARKMPSNGVADAEVVAVIKNAGGDLRKRSAKTDASGRAMFEGIAGGDHFRAEVTVDGEKLATDDITMPERGGVRTMLIGGLGAAPAGGAAGGRGEEEDFALGAATGKVTPDPALPAKTLVLALRDESGKPIGDHAVILGAIDLSNKIQVRRGRSDKDGTVRFTDLPTGTGFGYAAVIDWQGMKIGTEPFSMPDGGGARGEIRALARTSDPGVITVGAGGRVVLQMQEDSLQVLEIFPLENTSDKMFDPGPGAVEIPLPKEFVGAQTADNSARKLEVRASHGIAVHGPITPKRSLTAADARAAGNEVTFGYVLPYQGDSRELEQPMPNGIGPFVVITEQFKNLSVTGHGVGPRESRELGGKKFWVSPVEAIPPGGVLRLSITGLPSTDATGRVVSAVLAIALILTAILFARRPIDEAKVAADRERERLTARREALFAELVAVEQDVRAGKGGDGKNRRSGLVNELEGVYQQLAGLDEQRAR